MTFSVQKEKRCNNMYILTIWKLLFQSFVTLKQTWWKSWIMKGGMKSIFYRWSYYIFCCSSFRGKKIILFCALFAKLFSMHQRQLYLKKKYSKLWQPERYFLIFMLYEYLLLEQITDFALLWQTVLVQTRFLNVGKV